MEVTGLTQLTQRFPEVLYPSVEEAERVNRRRVEQNIAFFAANPDGIEARINELAEEWDVDRLLQVVAAAGSLAGVFFSVTRSRMWLLVSLVLSAGALHQAITFNSPAAAMARRLGFRTREEIESEMMALFALQEGAASGSTKSVSES